MSFQNVFADHWLPQAPLAAERKDGAYRRLSREHALQLPYIETNPLCLQSIVVTDHDGSEADQVADLVGLPQPSWVTLNPHTRSGHIAYALAAPVCLTDSARRKPINLLARIEQGLVDVLGGDVGYAGRVTKNPVHRQHMPLWGEETALYGLQELAQALGDVGALPGPSRTGKALTASSVGRNVALFHLTRQWAYRARLRYDDASEWEQTVHAFAVNKNLTAIAEEFTRGPLSEVEVLHLARSIARWTWRNITPELTTQRRKAWTAPEHQQRRAQRAADKRRIDRTHASKELFR